MTLAIPLLTLLVSLGPETPEGPPLFTVDLATRDGAASVAGEWRYSDARLVEVDFRSAGPDRQPTGPPNRAYDVVPHAGWADFDDASWPPIDPTTLADRRGTGRVSFAWYRLRFTVPERIGPFETSGTTIIFETAVDDAAEVWVDGELLRGPGQRGGSMVAGWNAPNRVVATRCARPGQKVTIAVFGINGPISAAPTNYIWLHHAKLDFYPGTAEPFAIAPSEANVEVVRLDPAIDEIVGPNPKILKLAENFEFLEGPVWTSERRLLFSDPNANRIYSYEPATNSLRVFREKSGYDGADVGLFFQPGSNGLALDAEGRLVACEHGRHRLTRTERDGSLTTLASSFDGKRLNSPNDVVFRKCDGSLYFTDPPFGLPRFHEDPRRELPFAGVFRLAADGALTLVSTDLEGPNGLAFSPDERTLYVTNWDPEKKVVMRYEVAADGSLGNGRVFFDMTDAPGEEALDGLKIDAAGNLYVSGPGGLWILSPEGRHLGTIRGPRLAANFAWGDADGKSLYMTARSGLYRMRLGIPGLRTAPIAASPAPAAPKVVRLDPRFDRLVPPGAIVEKVADGFEWVEGPAWNRRTGSLAFSDIPRNAVHEWREGAGTRLVLQPSGYTGSAPFAGREPGSNGLAFDAEGRLLLCEHGDRRVTRLEKDGTKTVLADRFDGKRLNSPNDLVLRPNGDVYFTDPPFGLPRTFDDPNRELPFCGVYRLTPDGRVTLLTRDLGAPNGLGFSPDGKTLYVSDAKRESAAWWAFDVLPDGGVANGRVLVDGRPLLALGPGGPDGLEVDREGNVFSAGPGGVHVFAPDGTRLGFIDLALPTGNCEWGGADGQTLFIAGDKAIWRVRLATGGPRS